MLCEFRSQKEHCGPEQLRSVYGGDENFKAKDGLKV